MFRKLLTREHTFPNTKVKSRDDLFKLFSERAFKLGLASSEEDFYAALVQREDQGSTEVAPGIAMPHAKHSCVKEAFLMVATSKKGIKYRGFSKVNLVFCLAAPQDDPLYMTLMAKTARLLKKAEFVSKITNSDVPEDILSSILSFEERLSGKEEQGQEGLHLLTLILNDEEEAKLAFPLFLELEIKNATILNSTYLLEKIQTDIPLFSIFSLGAKESFHSTTIIGLTSDPKTAGKLYSLLKEEGIDIWEPGKGVLFTFPLSFTFGGINPELNF